MYKSNKQTHAHTHTHTLIRIGMRVNTDLHIRTAALAQFMRAAYVYMVVVVVGECTIFLRLATHIHTNKRHTDLLQSKHLHICKCHFTLQQICTPTHLCMCHIYVPVWYSRIYVCLCVCKQRTERQAIHHFSASIKYKKVHQKTYGSAYVVVVFIVVAAFSYSLKNSYNFIINNNCQRIYVLLLS